MVDPARRSDFQPQPGRRVLPHSLEAERSVLGGVLLKPEAFVHVADIVREDDFYHPAHAAIYAAMVALDEASRPIDPITVAEQMRAKDTFGKLRAVNGEAYFVELTSDVVTIENIAFHARMVRGKATVRRLIEAAQEIAAHGYGEYGDVEEFIDNAEQSIFDIAQRSRQSGAMEKMSKSLASAVKRLEARYANRGAIVGVPSGYAKLDELHLGYCHDLHIIAARPSMGKTSYLACRMRNAAKLGIPQLLFSLETSKESMTDRLISQESRVDSERIRSGYLDMRDWNNVTKGCSIVHDLPIWIDDTGAPTLMEIRAKARRWRANPSEGGSHPMAAVWVDYLQLIAGKDQKQSREERVSEIGRGLKALAKELRCPVFALSQLNRAVESGSDHRPMLAHLRESGALEQDAYSVEFIYRDEVYNKDTTDKGIAEIIVAKNKDGRTGTVKLAWLAPYMLFENLSYRDDD